ncbi:hypothetical protein [Nostoc edaphicum]|nr:hypothetical protein [Nostoc edaphicum]
MRGFLQKLQGCDRYFIVFFYPKKGVSTGHIDVQVKAEMVTLWRD